ncbi:hypothetical protein [Enterobacter roggenkampii]|uniref:hypothetical protein n=1 Tax=Enterobacter roggenkampii TaxID=1812935 RepID=UPI0030CEB800
MVQATSPDAPDVAVIQDFERRLEKRFLRKEGAVWYADFTASPYPEELSVAGSYSEGATKPSPLMHTNATRPPGGPVLHIMVLSVSAADSILRKPGASTGKDSSTFIISGR